MKIPSVGCQAGYVIALIKKDSLSLVSPSYMTSEYNRCNTSFLFLFF